MYLDNIVKDISQLGIEHAEPTLCTTPNDGSGVQLFVGDVLAHTVFDKDNHRYTETAAQLRVNSYTPKTDIGRRAAEIFLAGARNQSHNTHWSTIQSEKQKHWFVGSCEDAENRFVRSIQDARDGEILQPKPIIITDEQNFVCAVLKARYEPSGLAFVDRPEFGLFAGTIFRANQLVRPMQIARRLPATMPLSTLGHCTPLRLSTFALTPKECQTLQEEGRALSSWEPLDELRKRVVQSLEFATPLSEVELALVR